MRASRSIDLPREGREARAHKRREVHECRCGDMEEYLSPIGLG